MKRFRRYSIRVPVLGILAAAWIVPVGAEVGVTTDSGKVKATYKLKIIVDDSDPTGGMWLRNEPDSAVRKVLNDQGLANGDGAPSLGVNADQSEAVAVWARNSPAGFDVVVSKFSQGSWSPATVVAASAADELDPVLVISPSDGSVHVFFWMNDAAPRVMYTQAPADLSSWTPAIQVSLPGEAACRPSAVLHAGTLKVAYESHGQTLGSTPRQIVVATKAGSSFATETVATTNHSAPNWPEIHGRGDRLWVDWIDAADEMAWTCSQAGGPWTTVQTETFTSIEARDFHIRGTIRWLALQQ